MKNYEIEYRRWLDSDKLSEAEREELISIADDEEAKALRFTAPMDFGTAGLRSVMNVGIGSMNRFTVAHTTRGIAALIKAEELLVESGAVVPVVYNQTFAFVSSELSGLTVDGFGNFVFTKVSQKNYKYYLPRED